MQTVNLDRVGGIEVTSPLPVSIQSGALPTGAAQDATLLTIDADLKTSQPRAVTQTTSPWVVSNNDGQMAAVRYQVSQMAQAAEMFAAQPQNGFAPTAEVPAFLGGF